MMFSRQSTIRNACISLSERKAFDHFILICIICSSILMYVDSHTHLYARMCAHMSTHMSLHRCVDNPTWTVDSDGWEGSFKRTLVVLDIVFVVIFTAELLIKVVVHALLRDMCIRMCIDVCMHMCMRLCVDVFVYPV